MNNDIKTFLGSNLFLGVPEFKKEKLWHGFLYMAESKSDKGIKIGYTNYDLKRRDKELKGFKSPRYMWSSPNPQLLEKYVKQILVQFTKNSKNKYADEIFYNIPINILVQTVRLIILYVVTKEQWIAGRFYYEKLYKYFGGPPFTTIKIDATEYTIQKREEKYVKGSRVRVLWEGEWVTGKINSGLIKGLKSKETNKVLGDGYDILFEDGSKYYRVLDKIEPLYDIDVNRIFYLKEAYSDCGIDIIDLKL